MNTNGPEYQALVDRHCELTEVKLTKGLTNEERNELAEVLAKLDTAEAPFYAPALKALNAEKAKLERMRAGMKVKLRVNVSGKPYTIEWADATGTVTRWDSGMAIVNIDAVPGKIQGGEVACWSNEISPL